MHRVNIAMRVKNAAEPNKKGGLRAVGVQHPEFSKAIVFIENVGVLGSEAVNGEISEIALYRDLYIATNELEHAPVIFFRN
jgi:hypothetical protein